MAISMQDAVRQNTLGYSEGTPLGVPSGFGWYKGVLKAADAPPAGFSSVTAWGQVYQDSGEPASSTAAAKVQVANAKTYVHVKSTGDWLLVQDQATSGGIAGGFYKTDFAGQTAMNMPVTKSGDGSATFAAPPNGYNNHFWPTARGTFAANDVDAVYVQMDMRVTDPNVNLVGQIGADWWRSSTAPFVHGFSNNPTAGTANWVDLSTEWKTLAFTSSTAVLQADPPPGLVGGPVNTPQLPTTPTTPELPTTPTPPQQQPSGDNLLVNGSFEAAAVSAGDWRGFGSIAGWTAVSGGTIELWNDLNGVKATNGQNFGELDFLGAADGLYQTVKTQAGQKYDLAFDARSRLGQTAATTAMDVLWNDKQVARVSPGSDWDTHNFTVTGTGGQDRLTFREAAGQGSDGLGALYDNVRLAKAGSAGSSAATLDKSMALMTQYSAAASGTDTAATTAFRDTNQENAAPTLTQTH